MGLPLEDRTAARLSRRKLATVLVDSQHPEFDCVNVDDEAGGYAAGAYLIEHGHQRLAFISEGGQLSACLPAAIRWRAGRPRRRRSRRSSARGATGEVACGSPAL